MVGFHVLISVKIISDLHVLTLVEVEEALIVPLRRFVETEPWHLVIPDGAPELKSVLLLSVLLRGVKILVPRQVVDIV